MIQVKSIIHLVNRNIVSFVTRRLGMLDAIDDWIDASVECTLSGSGKRRAAPKKFELKQDARSQ